MKAALRLLAPLSPPLTPTSNPSNKIIRLPSTILPLKTLNYFPSFPLNSQNPRNNFTRLMLFAAENGSNGNGDNIGDLLSNDENKQGEKGENGLNGNGESINGDGICTGREKSNGNGRPRLNLEWIDLLIDPDPDNVVAVGLTGVLAWASVQVLWQLFATSIAILLAALKYSFIAAVLIFILVTLL